MSLFRWLMELDSLANQSTAWDGLERDIESILDSDTVGGIIVFV